MQATAGIFGWIQKIKETCLEVTERKLQKNATPIREGVVNLEKHHTMDDLQTLADEIEKKFHIQCFQIYIHYDEGKSRDELNYHAHMLFDWTDRRDIVDKAELGGLVKSGNQREGELVENNYKARMLKLRAHHMSQINDLTADVLKMERGKLKVNTNRVRLEPIEYKRQQEEIRLKELQNEIDILEQKKNTATERNRQARERINRAGEEDSREINKFSEEGIDMDWKSIKGKTDQISRAIELQQGNIQDQERALRSTAEELGNITMAIIAAEKEEAEYQRLEREIARVEKN